MKTLNSLLFVAILFLSTIAAKAADGPVPVKKAKLSQSYAVNTYVNAISQGKLAGLDNVIDASAKFSLMRGDKVLCFDKEQIMKFMNANADVKQDCTTTTTMVENNPDYTVVKVDMQYENFTRSNYVTLTNTGIGWKIINVHSVFK
jgi:hypothetical protein